MFFNGKTPYFWRFWGFFGRFLKTQETRDSAGYFGLAKNALQSHTRKTVVFHQKTRKNAFWKTRNSTGNFRVLVFNEKNTFFSKKNGKKTRKKKRKNRRFCFCFFPVFCLPWGPLGDPFGHVRGVFGTPWVPGNPEKTDKTEKQENAVVIVQRPCPFFSEKNHQKPQNHPWVVYGARARKRARRGTPQGSPRGPQEGNPWGIPTEAKKRDFFAKKAKKKRKKREKTQKTAVLPLFFGFS